MTRVLLSVQGYMIFQWPELQAAVWLLPAWASPLCRPVGMWLWRRRSFPPPQTAVSSEPWVFLHEATSLPARQQVRVLFPGSALGGHPCHRILPHEPDAHPAARPQRVPERASLSQRHRRVRAAHPGSRQRSCPSRRGLDNSLIFNPLRKTLRGWSECWTWIICRDYQRKMPYLA